METENREIFEPGRTLAPPAFDRSRIAAALGDVRPRPPLRSPATRAAFLALGGAGIAILALAAMRLRADLSEVSWLVTWAPAAFELAAGACALFLSMKWALPGAGTTLAGSSAFASIVVATVLASAVFAPGLVPASHPGLLAGASPAGGLGCLGREMIVSAPALVAALALIVRAAPARAWLSGALAGLGAALIGDAAIHLHCSDVAPAHTLIWHLGASVVLTAAGALFARVLARW